MVACGNTVLLTGHTLGKGAVGGLFLTFLQLVTGSQPTSRKRCELFITS
jgi:hypothetical protein